jgi:hypothetical protein
MTLSRREFHKSSIGLLALAAGGSLTLTGCNSLESYLQLALDGVESLITLLGLPTTNPLVADVLAAFAAAIAGAQKYGDDNVAGDSVLVSLLDAVDAALQTFLSQATIPSALITLVLQAVELIISTIRGWVGKTPVTQLTAKMGASVSVTPVKRNKRTFVKAWNEVVTVNSHPELKLKGWLL